MDEIQRALWKSYPSVRLLPVVCVGILVSQNHTDHPIYSNLSLLIVLLLVFNASGRWIRQLGLVVLLLLGFNLSPSKVAGTAPVPDRSKIIEIIDPPQEKSRSVQARIRYPTTDQVVRILIYLEKDDRSLDLKQGDLLYADLKVSPVNTDALPGDFNYGRYLKRQGIDYTAYVASENWEPLQAGNNSLKRIHGRLQVQLSSILESHIAPQTEGLVKAMFLGIRSDLDRELRHEFARSGVMHILAVSGLHVSIVWLLVSSVLKPLTNRFKWFRPIGLGLELLSVWLFAWFTGFGPSVQRAAFMFSLFSFARTLGWSRISVNVTAGSAIILLIFHPKLLFEPGFQLSYAAVFGILLFFPIIHQMLSFKNQLARYLWSLQCVSCAAVLGTAPLSMYYFHQLPLLFPISNIVAVPAAFLLVGSCPLLFMVSPLPHLAELLGQFISLIGMLLIQSMQWISNLPYSVWNNIYMGRFELFAGYGLLLLIYRWLAFSHHRLQSSLLILLLLLITFSVHCSTKVIEYQSQEFYMANDYTLLINSGNHQAVILREESAPTYSSDLAGNRKFHRIRSIDSLTVSAELFREYQLLAIRSMHATDQVWPDRPYSIPPP